MKNKIAELKAQLNKDAPRERSASSSDKEGFTFVSCLSHFETCHSVFSLFHEFQILKLAYLQTVSQCHKSQIFTTVLLVNSLFSLLPDFCRRRLSISKVTSTSSRASRPRR